MGIWIGIGIGIRIWIGIGMLIWIFAKCECWCSFCGFSWGVFGSEMRDEEGRREKKKNNERKVIDISCVVQTEDERRYAALFKIFRMLDVEF